MECHHMTFPRENKFKSVPSAEKIMATLFWDEKGVILGTPCLGRQQ
jgi:hypothetical protein